MLDQFLDRDGYFHVNYGVGNGKYRIFGTHHNHALTLHGRLGVSVAVDPPLESVTLYDSKTGAKYETLRYESFSGDWAVASFSNDGSVIAVVEPQYVTFFSKEKGAN